MRAGGERMELELELDGDEATARRIGELAVERYGPGECTVEVDGSTAAITRDGARLCAVTCFDGFPLHALERFLVRRMRPGRPI